MEASDRTEVVDFMRQPMGQLEIAGFLRVGTQPPLAIAEVAAKVVLGKLRHGKSRVIECTECGGSTPNSTHPLRTRLHFLQPVSPPFTSPEPN